MDDGDDSDEDDDDDDDEDETPVTVTIGVLNKYIMVVVFLDNTKCVLIKLELSSLKNN